MPSTRHTMALLQRRQEVATRYLQGEQQYHIARALGVSQSQISLDLKMIRELWLASLLRDFDAATSQELAKIDQAEIAYWAGWSRSQQPREVTLTEATEGGEYVDQDGTRQGKAPTRKASVRKEGQAGDPRFLDGVLKCVETRCKLLGLNAPQHYVIDWETLSETQLLRLAQGEAPPQVMAEA